MNRHREVTGKVLMGTPPRWTGRRGRAGEDEADDGAMSKRAVSAVVRLVVPAGAAKPSPPVGPALGQHGVNIMSFCKDFNAKTSEHKAETPVPVVIEIYGDKTFEWTMKTPPTSYFVARAAGVKTCSQRPGHACLLYTSDAADDTP